MGPLKVLSRVGSGGALGAAEEGRSPSYYSPRNGALFSKPHRSIPDRKVLGIIGSAVLLLLCFSSMHWGGWAWTMGESLEVPVHGRSLAAERVPLSVGVEEVEGGDKLAAAVAKIRQETGTNVIITSIVNSGYLDFTENWLASIAKQGHLDKVLLFAEDAKAFNYIESRWPGHVVSLDHEKIPHANGSAHDFGSLGFYLMTERRPDYLKSILRFDVNVFYNDLDMVWLKDPLPTFKGGDFDMWVMDDWGEPGYFKPGEKVTPMYWDERDTPNACSCLIYMRPTEASFHALDRWTALMSRRQWEPNVQDQPYFNKALNTVPELRVGVVPQQHYPPGPYFFDDDEWRESFGKTSRIVHNNWVVGHDKKLNRFKKVGQWHVEDGTMRAIEELSKAL